MSYLDDLIEKVAQMLVPTGTVIMFAGNEVPEGYILWQEFKVYQSEFPKLFARLNSLSRLQKGSDGKGAWVQLPDIDGRVLQACSNVSDVGQLLEAQLPNITGTINHLASNSDRAEGKGAMCWSESSGGPYASSKDPTLRGGFDPKIDASMVSSIYSGDSLQPRAIQLLTCIRC